MSMESPQEVQVDAGADGSNDRDAYSFEVDRHLYTLPAAFALSIRETGSSSFEAHTSIAAPDIFRRIEGLGITPEKAMAAWEKAFHDQYQVLFAKEWGEMSPFEHIQWKTFFAYAEHGNLNPGPLLLDRFIIFEITGLSATHITLQGIDGTQVTIPLTDFPHVSDGTGIRVGTHVGCNLTVESSSGRVSRIRIHSAKIEEMGSALPSYEEIW